MSELLFGRFVLSPVLGRIMPTEAAEVAAMWVGEGALAAPEAERRTAEVLFLIRDGSSGMLAGVCTVYPARLSDTGDAYWHFRMFMSRKFRGASGLPRFLLLATYQYLRHHGGSGGAILRGVAVVGENPAFRRHRSREYFAKQNPPWRWLGANSRGHDVFYCDFPKP
jgi:hypothetical protein